LKQRDKIHIIHVGFSGIPFARNASVNRCLAIYSLLSEDIFSILIVNNRAVSHIEMPFNVKSRGEFLNFKYLFTTLNQYKPKGFFKRRINNLIGRINEFFLLVKLGSKNQIDVMFFYPKGNFFELIYYWFFSKLFNFSIISQYVEYRSEFKSRNNLWNRINDKFFDEYFMFFVDGVIPISQYLIKKVKERRINMPILKIPPVVDFNNFKGIKEKRVNYFLYVGHAGYKQAITLILDSFELVVDNSYYLYLIISGNKDSILEKIEKHKKKDQIKIFSNIEYNELIQYYMNARALLIPLSDSIQDRARFPQKISEYLASANPIITTNFGEIPYYFTDNVNALIVNEDTPTLIAEKMNYITNNQDEAERIGKNGYDTGKRFFNSWSYKDELKDFIFQFIKKN